MSKRICMGCMEHYSEKYDVCPYCGYAEGTPPKEAYHLEPGTVLQGKYIVGKVIGYGGFGVTYIGYNAILDQKIAIKEYLPGEFATRCTGVADVTVFSGDREEQFANGIIKFIEEARKLAKFKSVPGIVRIYDSFTENRTAYIVMEYLEGETLKERLEREEKIPLDEALNITMPIIEALKEVHSEGILHRDISPDNIFLTKGGEVKLLDFGAARYATTTHSKSLSVIVKPGYAPQEQYRSRGDQGTWTDVYALAATLYKMITGVTPEDSMERGNKDTLLPPSKLGIKIPKNKENAIMNALNLRIEDRTQTAEDFETDLSSEDEVKRNKIHFRKMDIGRWPLWLKITSGAAALSIVTLVVLLVTGVISLGAINIFDKGDLDKGTVYVPNVVNYSLAEAENKITETKLLPQIVDKQNSDIIPKDMVLSQGITDGEVVQEGTVLELTVSAGGEIVYLTDLEGMSLEEAEALMEEMGLYLETKEEESDIAPGCIVRMELEEGTGIEKGSTVTVYVSTGKGYDDNQTAEVPELKGITWEEGKKKVASAKLYIHKTASEYSDSIPKGEIISQDPVAGTKVNQGTSVGVVVSLGIMMTRVPDVQYKTQAEAERLLSEAKLNVSIQHEDNNSVAKGHVIRQSIEPGTEVEMQTTVTIYISNGNPAAETAPEYIPSGESNGGSANNNPPPVTPQGTTQLPDTEEEYIPEEQPATQQPTTQPPATQPTTAQPTTVQPTTEPPVQPEPEDGNIKVPDLVGLTEAQAKEKLSDSKLQVGSVSYQHDDSKMDGVVLSQGVESGTKVAKNSSINIVICNNERYSEYRYRTRTTTTSTSSSLSGWTRYDSSTSWSSWGNWSDWSTTAVSIDDFTDVETKKETQTNVPDNPSPSGYPIPTSTWSRTNSSPSNEVKWIQEFLNEYFGWTIGLDIDGIYGGTTMYFVGDFQNIEMGTADKSVGANTRSKMLEVWRRMKTTTTETTYYRYRKRTKTTTYYYEKWSEWSSWSTSPKESSDTVQVEERTRYRY